MRFSCQGRSRDSGAKQPLQGNSMSVKSAKQISQKYRFYICPIRTATETENQIGMWQLVLDNTRPMPDFHVKNHIYDLLSSIIKGFPALILCAKCWKPSSTSGCCSYFEIQRLSVGLVKFNTYCNLPRVTATQNKGCCNNPWIFILSKLCKLGLYCII